MKHEDASILPGKIHWSDWDFSGVQSDQVTECCLWEMLRELPLFSDREHIAKAKDPYYLDNPGNLEEFYNKRSIDAVLIRTQLYNPEARKFNGHLDGAPLRVLLAAINSEKPLTPWLILKGNIGDVPLSYHKSLPGVLNIGEQDLSPEQQDYLSDVAWCESFGRNSGKWLENPSYTSMTAKEILLKAQLLTEENFIINWIDCTPMEIKAAFSQWVDQKENVRKLPNRGKGQRLKLDNELSWIAAKRLLEVGYKDFNNLPEKVQERIKKGPWCLSQHIPFKELAKRIEKRIQEVFEDQSKDIPETDM